MAAPHASDATELRLLRAAVFTAVCVVLSAGGHVLASNETVPLWTLGVAAVLVFAVAVPLAGRERSLPGIAALLAVGQVGLHGVFGLGQHCAVGGGDAGGAGVGGPGGGGGALALARRLLCNDHAADLTEGRAREIVADAGLDPDAGLGGAAGATGAAGAHAGHGVGLGDGPGAAFNLAAYSLPMVLGHVLAALVAGWLLRRGDAAVTTLLHLTVATGADLGPLRAAVRYMRVLDTGLDDSGRPAVRPGAATAYDEQSARTVRELQHAVVRRGPPALALAA